MRLSEMPAEKAFEIMTTLLPYVSEILEDQDIKKGAELSKAKGKDLKMSDLLPVSFPALLCTHREAVLQISAHVQGMTVQDVQQKPLGDMMTAFDEAMKDMTDFFMLSVRMVARA